MPNRVCVHGYAVSDKAMSCGLKHMYIMEQIASRKFKVERHFSFSIVLEDDEILPTNFLEQIIVVKLYILYTLYSIFYTLYYILYSTQVSISNK
jgi:hypothetical protein